MKKIITKSLTIITMLALLFTLALPMTANAKAKPKISKTKTTLTITNKKHPTVTLKIKNANSKKAVKWTTTNKKVATVKKTGKYTCKVTARKAGKAKITCKVNGKKYTCKVVVKNKRNCIPDTNTKNCTCNHTWKEHKITLYYRACICGEVFYGKTADTAGQAWNVHVVENIDNYADHCGCSPGTEKYVNYKTCTKCGEKVEYDVP